MPGKLWYRIRRLPTAWSHYMFRKQATGRSRRSLDYFLSPPVSFSVWDPRVRCLVGGYIELHTWVAWSTSETQHAAGQNLNKLTPQCDVALFKWFMVILQIKEQRMNNYRFSFDRGGFHWEHTSWRSIRYCLSGLLRKMVRCLGDWDCCEFHFHSIFFEHSRFSLLVEFSWHILAHSKTRSEGLYTMRK